MQKPIKRGSAYRIQIKYKYLRDSATFDTHNECEKWAEKRLIELKLQYANDLKYGRKEHFPLLKLFHLYFEKEAQFKKSRNYVSNHIHALYLYYGELTYKSIHEITPQDIAGNRDRRLKQVNPSTVNREMALTSSVFSFAVKELFLLKENPCSHVKKPQPNRARNNRINTEYEDKVLEGLKYVRGSIPNEPRHYVAWSFLFALATAMRKGEILSLNHASVFPDFVRLNDTKNGYPRDVPLTKDAMELLKLLPKQNDKLIPLSSNAFRLIWQRNLHRVSLNKIITFHDTRHEAITRFVHKYKLPVEILAKITGHKTISVLVNTYYNPTASEIASMLQVA
ncbi:tyrosine-type recombinase/integrase [Acinetobacter gerneri]|uniref:tyrosine-type recombinase/integrase n=1 Tax=Acinetobacter gerneri TaxID=202952 RepID=UPI003A873F5B